MHAESEHLHGGAAELEWHYSQNGTAPLLPSDSVHIVLPKEGVNGDSRILSAKQNVDAKTHVLETVMKLRREKPLLAEYLFSLKSKTYSLSRYNLANV